MPRLSGTGVEEATAALEDAEEEAAAAEAEVTAAVAEMCVSDAAATIISWLVARCRILVAETEIPAEEEEQRLTITIIIFPPPPAPAGSNALPLHPLPIVRSQRPSRSCPLMTPSTIHHLGAAVHRACAPW